MAIDWGLAQTPNFGAALMGGYQAGRAIGREKRTQAALTGYQTDPDAAITQAYGFDPELGDQLSQRRARTLYSEGLATGKPDARIAGLDPALWQKLDAQQKAQVKQSTEFLGNAAFDIGKRPEAERPAAWAAYVKNAEANGMDIPSQYETYSPEALQGIIAQTGKTAEWIKANEPDYLAVPKDADLVNLRDPGAIRQFQAPVGPVGSQADYDALPPGAEYTAPDGSVRRKGGAASNGGGNFP